MSSDPASSVLLPAEERDQEEQAKAWYDEPTRTLNRKLVKENMQLKKLLRELGISWDPRLTLDPDNPTRGTWASPKRNPTRRSKGPGPLSQESQHLPVLPVELQLYILEHALTSKDPIIDPLSKSNKDALTAAERTRGNQIAIGFLATCKAFLVEGTRFLWRNNTFVFTSHLALRNLANLSLEYRMGIKHVTLRVIARYYDDEERKHLAPYPTSVISYYRDINLKAVPRVKEANLSRQGFRSYTWDQVVDFLDAMRPPYDPGHPKGQPRPRLLPDLESLRMDFVNFPDSFLTPGGGPFLHNFAAHDLGCTLNELQLTGLPDCDFGEDMVAQLTGMVKDDGLLLKSDATFVFSGNQLRPMAGRERWMPEWLPKAVRSWKVLAEEYASTRRASSSSTHSSQSSHVPRNSHAKMPPAPQEEGHPESPWTKRRTLFKYVPLEQDDDERFWMEFDRLTGLPLEPDEYDPEDDDYDIEDLVCASCDVIHPPVGDH